MDSDVPHNQAGGTETETGAKVLPFRGEWFGSPDDLVPFGPRAHAEKNAVADRAGTAANRTEPDTSQEPAPAEPAKPSGQPRVGADAFWAGLADAGDLIEFPAAVAPAPSSVGPGSWLAYRRRPVWGAVAVAVLGLVVIGLRLSSAAGGGTPQPGMARTHTALSIAKSPVGATGVDQQQLRPVPLPVRLPARTHRAKPQIVTHPARRATRRVLVQTRPSSVHAQPAVYSTPPPAQRPSAPASGSRTGGSSSGSGGGGGGGGGGSGGGRSTGGGAHRSGPSGRAAAFGPGKMGG